MSAISSLAKLTVVGLALFGGKLTAEECDWKPFPVDWSSDAESPADVSFLLDRPAGKDGFIRVEGGHLVRPSGDRFRIWGVNITAKATLPPKEAAPRLAAHLARTGINCVRLHFLDRVAPQGLIDAGRNDTCALDPAQLDRLDFFIAQLRDRGIYTNLNLNVGRTYQRGDGVRDYELLGYAKGLTYFHPRLIELQKQYARQLLTHRNAYTGNEYRCEPAVAVVEMVNENSIVESWFAGRLLGKNTRKNPGTWTDIPASYEAELTDRYNRWLGQHVSGEQLARLRAASGVASDQPVPRLRPAEFVSAPEERFYTEARFYMELERRYFDMMADYLRDELGVKSLLVGTSDHNHGKSGYPLLASTARLDIVDGHVYWQHPRYLTDPATGRRTGFEIPNTPMVSDPLRSTVVQLSRSAVAGKPYTVSEVNHPFPNEYACEGIPILSAYAALHDWDGVYWYTLAHDHLVGEDARALGHFDLGPDPIKMTQLAAGALMFLRADVRPANRTVGRSYSIQQVYESLRLPRSESPYFTPGFPTGLSLVHATRITSLDGPPTESFPPSPAQPYVSDTQELRWIGASAKRGMVVVDTPKSQAIIGFSKENPPSTENLGVRIDNPFSAVTLSTLDEKTIAESSRLLLTTSAHVSNSGMQWDDRRRTLKRWGTPPALMEPVTGRARLRNLNDASRVSSQALDGAGRALGPPLPATRTDEGWDLKLGDPATTWYAVTVTRE